MKLLATFGAFFALFLTTANANVNVFDTEGINKEIYSKPARHFRSIKGVEFYKKDYMVSRELQLGSLFAIVNTDNEVKCVKINIKDSQNIKVVGELGMFELAEFEKLRVGGFQVDSLGKRWKVNLETLVKYGTCE